MHNNCLSCKEKTFLDKNTSTCVNLCPDNYYENSKTSQCDICKADCLKCNEINENICTKCGKNTFLLNGRCIDKCPDKYFENNIKNECI